MVRYTIAIAGKPHEGIAEMSVEERIVDIFGNEQLEEQFLRDINPKGQVCSGSSQVLHEIDCLCRCLRLPPRQ